MRKNMIRKLTVSAMMAAIGILLMSTLEIPFVFFAPWLKLDFSTIPVLLAGFSLGPVWGIAVQLVKSLGHLPFSTSAGVGEIADLLVGIAMVVPASLMYMKLRSRKGALIGMAIGTVLMMIVGAVSNYFIILPAFFGGDIAGGIAGMLGGREHINDLGSYITLAVLPFNFIKGAAVSIITVLLYKRISPLLHGTWRKTRDERKNPNNHA